MRGKTVAHAVVCGVVGVTPAYAGKSMSQRSLPLLYLGSPPRMRGKVRLLRPEVHELGITPAYAGKRDTSELKYVRDEDHPRVCGEKRLYSLPCHQKWGSPPHMRGKVNLRAQVWPLDGITPAYAGKSL